VLVVKGARVFTADGLVNTDVVIDQERIAQMGNIDPTPDLTVIDGTGQILGPGFVDLHVHVREPGQTWKEDLDSVSAAALVGGFTGLVAMPNTEPAMDSGTVYDSISNRLAAADVAIVVAGALTMGRRGEAMSHLDDLYDRGVRIFTDDGDCVGDAGLLRDVMRYLSDRPDVVIAQHAEERSISRNGHLHDGIVGAKLGIKGVPAAAEAVVIARDLVLAAEFGIHYHAQHISAAESVELIRRAKSEGVMVTAEVTPHHLALTEDSLAGLDPNMKMYPPLRSPADREALIAGLEDGTIDAVATDHAPHTVEEKDVTFEDAPRGVIGLETALPAVLGALNGNIETLFQRMSVQPSEIAGLADQGQFVSVGAVANLVLVDPNAGWVPEHFVSRSSNSPFWGTHLVGRVSRTFRNGAIVYEGVR
jgi:dihydroorotase